MNLVQIIIVGFMVGQIAVWDEPTTTVEQTEVRASESTTAVQSPSKDEQADT